MAKLFAITANPFDDVIEKATNEKLTSENWGLVVEVCDRIQQAGSKGPKECLQSIAKRLHHRDPHVTLLALSLLDSCMSNCGKPFHLEVCTKDFIHTLKSLATEGNHKVGEKTRLLIKRWVEEECKSDASLSLLSTLYNNLKVEGWQFSSSEPPKRSQISSAALKNPDVAESQQEADDLAKAIQLSLKDSGGTAGSNLPSASVTSTTIYPLSDTQQQPTRVVKALYEFEAAEDNELTFKAGEYITVLDDSDVNWWKGSSHRGQGLFPASFVTSDLTAVVESIPAINTKKKSVQFDETVAIKTLPVDEEREPVTIDPEKLEKCLSLLHETDPTGNRPDVPELLQMEDACLAMEPLIDKELENIDKQHSELAEMNVKLMDALDMYNMAMNEAQKKLFASQQQYNSYAAAVQQVPYDYAASIPSGFVPSLQQQQPYSNIVTTSGAALANQAFVQQQQAYAYANQFPTVGMLPAQQHMSVSDANSSIQYMAPTQPTYVYSTPQ